MKPNSVIICFVISLSLIFNYRNHNSQTHGKVPLKAIITGADSIYPAIHVMVALCDNKYQGIVPVPPKIGNGQDVNSNLYWGCGFGVRSYFKKSADWQFIKTLKPGNKILERLVFKHRTKNTYLVADAYDGQFIKDCTLDFLRACSGQLKDTICLKEKHWAFWGIPN